MVEYLRLHIQTMRHAMLGASGTTHGIFHILDNVQGFAIMQKDLMDTYEDAQELTMLTLKHEAGEFTGLEKMVSLQDLDTLDGFEESIRAVNNLEGVGFPKGEIETMEDDLLCQ